MIKVQFTGAVIAELLTQGHTASATVTKGLPPGCQLVRVSSGRFPGAGSVFTAWFAEPLDAEGGQLERRGLTPLEITFETPTEG